MHHINSSIFVLGSFVASCSVKVQRLPRPGESVCAEAFTLEAGGKGFNLAVGARRLGAVVDGVFVVGDDLFGELAEPAFDRANLARTLVRLHSGTQTGSGVGFTDSEGENCLAVYPGANHLLSIDDIRAASSLPKARLVLAQFEIGDEPIREAFSIARAAGATTLLNPSPVRPLDTRILSNTSILVVNRVEAAALANEPALGVAQGGAAGMESIAQLAMRLLARGLEMVVVTLGSDGAFLCQRGGASMHQPAFPVDTVDTLGAGDAFTAGLAVSLSEGRPLTECLRRAAACGALATKRLGIFDALPERRELDEFLSTVNA